MYNVKYSSHYLFNKTIFNELRTFNINLFTTSYSCYIWIVRNTCQTIVAYDTLSTNGPFTFHRTKRSVVCTRVDNRASHVSCVR